MKCCVCDEDLKHGQRAVVAYDYSAIVHDKTCGFYTPHRRLTLAEQEQVKSWTRQWCSFHGGYCGVIVE